jgi:Polysaccharide pyruvyl transferase
MTRGNVQKTGQGEIVAEVPSPKEVLSDEDAGHASQGAFVSSVVPAFVARRGAVIGAEAAYCPPGMQPAITLLSTYFENVGDDLIRIGVQSQIRSVVGSEPRWEHVTKSNPLSLSQPVSRRTHAPVGRMLPEERAAAAPSSSSEASPLRDKIRHCDAFVVAGTPIFTFVGDRSFLDIEATSGGDWPRIVFAERVESAPEPPMIALGVGSIFEGPPDVTLANHRPAAEFIRRFVDRAALVTTRDGPTDALLRAACPDLQARIVRTICPSFWAAPELAAVRPAPQRRVTIGFALESVNWDLSASRQELIEARERAFSRVITYFRERDYAIVLVAHNEYDVAASERVAGRRGMPAAELVSAERLVDAICSSAVVVTWRVHGAIAARSVGRPALLFRTDSRSASAAELGALVFDDRTGSREGLTSMLDRLCEVGAGDPASAMAAADAVRADELARIRGALGAALGSGG